MRPVLLPRSESQRLLPGLLLLGLDILKRESTRPLIGASLPRNASTSASKQQHPCSKSTKRRVRNHSNGVSSRVPTVPLCVTVERYGEMIR